MKFRSSSQFGEDFRAFLLNSRRTDGYYVEIGGNSPIFDSTTFGLYLLGWHGLVIEPNPAHRPIHEIVRPRDSYIEAAAWSENKDVVLNIPEINGWARSAEFGNNSKLFSSSENLRTIEVSGVRVSTVLEKLNIQTPIDFMSIDVEGDSIKVLEGIDFSTHRPKIICIEAGEYINWSSQDSQDNSEAIISFLCKEKYLKIGVDPANIWFRDELSSEPQEIFPQKIKSKFELLKPGDFQGIVSAFPPQIEWSDICELTIEMFKRANEQISRLESSVFFKFYLILKKTLRRN
jgi:FkbM family methyltransferase